MKHNLKKPVENVVSATALLPTLVRSTKEVDNPLRLLKWGIWAYFLLLIFEGGLRKRFLPGLATPLLIVRDPIGLWLLFMAWQRNLLPTNIYASGMVLLGMLGAVTAILLGHGSIPVAVYGARILVIHFPLMFVIGRIFDREDVVKMGKTILWIAIPTALLIILQFYSPQSAWVNRGVGGDMEGAGFDGALGFFRPPGTFSFTNGNSMFYHLVSCFAVYFWLQPKGINRLLLLGATGALFIVIPLSISRSLLFSVVVTVLFAVLATSRKPEYLGRIVLAGMGGVVVLAVFSQLSFFQTATEAFTARFDSANENEGGLEGVLMDRYLGGMVGALAESTKQPFFGYGLGMGTNVGSMLLSGGLTFLISEGEWGRVIGEMGPLLGLAVIFLRLGLCAKIAMACYQKLVRGDLLPWMLLSFGLLTMPQAQWAQPTALGFSTMIGGLLIASLRQPLESKKPSHEKMGRVASSGLGKFSHKRTSFTHPTV